MPHAQKIDNWQRRVEDDPRDDIETRLEDTHLHHDPEGWRPARHRVATAQEMLIEDARTNAGKYLRRAFRACTEYELQNLETAAKRQIPICCGKRAHLYTDGKGAYCPIVLACGLPAMQAHGEIKEKAMSGEGKRIWNAMLARFRAVTDNMFLEALHSADENLVRDSILVVLEEKGIAS